MVASCITTRRPLAGDGAQSIGSFAGFDCAGVAEFAGICHLEAISCLFSEAVSEFLNRWSAVRLCPGSPQRIPRAYAGAPEESSRGLRSVSRSLFLASDLNKASLRVESNFSIESRCPRSMCALFDAGVPGGGAPRGCSRARISRGRKP